MTRDLTPSREDLRRLVEKYGSIWHAANAIGVDVAELRAWMSGKKEIPLEYFEALLSLIGDSKKGS